MEQLGSPVNVFSQTVQAETSIFDPRSGDPHEFSIFENLQVTEIFAAARATDAAFSLKTSMSENLDADPALIVPQTIPFPFPPDTPPEK